MKGNNVDKCIRDVVIENLDYIVIGFLFLCSLVIRYHLMKHGSSSDYVAYIIPWVEQYRNSTRDAFREGVGDYYIPYNILLAIASKINIPTNYSVGTISCIFDYLTAFFIYRIYSGSFAGVISKHIARIIAVCYLFVPTIVLNGATWKQCDAIYSFFLVALLKCLFDKRFRAAFIMLGISFSFKQQAIFIVPFLIIIYFVNKEIKLVYVMYSILVYLIAGLPAIVMGRPATEVYMIYFNQVAKYHQMTLNYPNLYMIAMTDYEKLHIYAVLFTVFVFTLAFYFLVKRGRALTNKDMIFLATWSVWTSCMFLPAMHQRYDYMVAVLMVLLVPLVIKEQAAVPTIICATLFYMGNIITYSYSLFGDDYSNILAFCCNGISYCMFCLLYFIGMLKNES